MDESAQTTLDPRVFCQNCRWILEQKHPQAWIMLSSDDTKSGKIPVEKARKLCDELAKEFTVCSSSCDRRRFTREFS